MADDPNTDPSLQPRQASGFPPPHGLDPGYAAEHTIIYGRETNGVGVAAGVCGVIAVGLCWIPFVDYVSIVLGALAIIFGVIGVRRADALDGSGKVIAITGVVCGIVGLTIALLFLLLIYAVTSTVTANG